VFRAVAPMDGLVHSDPTIFGRPLGFWIFALVVSAASGYGKESNGGSRATTSPSKLLLFRDRRSAAPYDLNASAVPVELQLVEPVRAFGKPLDTQEQHRLDEFRFNLLWRPRGLHDGKSGPTTASFKSVFALRVAQVSIAVCIRVVGKRFAVTVDLCSGHHISQHRHLSVKSTSGDNALPGCDWRGGEPRGLGPAFAPP
jgi:hypothetical protein